MDGWINGSMDISINVWIDQMNEKWEDKGFKEPRTKRKRERGGAVGGEWRKMRGNAVKEHYSQNSCSCVIYPVDGAQSKCKCKCWFVLYAFLWTYRDTENLKHSKLYTAHMPGSWRGGRWSEKCQLGRCMNQRWGAQARTHQKYVLAQWFVDVTDFFPETTVFYD